MVLPLFGKEECKSGLLSAADMVTARMKAPKVLMPRCTLHTKYIKSETALCR